MKHKITPLVVTTFDSPWFVGDLPKIQSVLQQMENVTIHPFHLRSFSPAQPPDTHVNPGTEGPRISYDWYRKHITPMAREGGYNMVFFVFSRRERNDWGLYKGWAGLYYNDIDDVYECYVAVDPGDHEEFLRIMVHEALHGAVRWSGMLPELDKRYNIPYARTGGRSVIDNVVHHFDYVLNNVDALAPLVSFKRWGILSDILALLQKSVPAILAYYKKVKETEALPREPERIPMPPKPNEGVSQIIKMAKAIEVFEDYVRPGEKYRDGSIAQYGSKSYRNCNPGNLRWSPFQAGQRDGFSYFDTYEEGFDALVHQLKIACDGRSKVYKPTMTLLEFFNVYAPSSDGNFPRTYAKFVAERMGVPVDTIIGDLV